MTIIVIFQPAHNCIMYLKNKRKT